MDIAIATRNIEISEMAFFITNQKKIHNISLYCLEKVEDMFGYGFSIFPISEISYFTGDFIIATDINSCKLCLNSNNNKNIIFYIHDLEWTRNKNFNYEYYSKIYRDKRLKLFCKSKYYSDIMKSSWNVDCDYIEDFNIETMVEKYEKINI